MAELRKEKDERGTVEWEVATEMSEFEPVRKVLFLMAVTSTKDAVPAKYHDLDLGFLEFKEEVEDTISKVAELGPKGKRIAGDDAEPPKEKEGESEPTSGLRWKNRRSKERWWS